MCSFFQCSFVMNTDVHGLKIWRDVFPNFPSTMVLNHSKVDTLFELLNFYLKGFCVCIYCDERVQNAENKMKNKKVKIIAERSSEEYVSSQINCIFGQNFFFLFFFLFISEKIFRPCQSSFHHR